ncbi:MAG: sugar ABC transporter permease, partial [Rhizobiales bacterium]|nr:sugar ABC transporter permease [Hyphomicrobiales bacterium]
MSAVAASASSGPWRRKRLAARGLDGTTLLVLPGIVTTLLLFVYPFLYGVVDSLAPKEGPWFANYVKFFSEPFQYDTIFATLWLALPVTIINVVVAIPIAFRVRLMRRQRLLTTILVLPVTLGTVLVADGL